MPSELARIYCLLHLLLLWHEERSLEPGNCNTHSSTQGGSCSDALLVAGCKLRRSVCSHTVLHHISGNCIEACSENLVYGYGLFGPSCQRLCFLVFDLLSIISSTCMSCDCSPHAMVFRMSQKDLSAGGKRRGVGSLG